MSGRPASRTLGSRGGRNTERVESVVARWALAYRLELVQECWDALRAGEFLTQAASRVGTSRATVRRMLHAAGGVRPRRGRNLQGRYLSFAEQKRIRKRAPWITLATTLLADVRVTRISTARARRGPRNLCLAGPTLCEHLVAALDSLPESSGALHNVWSAHRGHSRS